MHHITNLIKCLLSSRDAAVRYAIQAVTIVQCHIHIGMLRRNPPKFLLLEGVGLALAEILLNSASNGTISGELLSNSTL